METTMVGVNRSSRPGNLDVGYGGPVTESTTLREIQDRYPLLDVFPETDGAPQLVLCVMRTAALLERVVARALMPFRLHYAQFNALVLLDREREGLRPSVLGSYLCVSRPNVTKLLARLKDRGLVVEKSDPQDGRAVLAVITEEGIGLVQLAFVAVTRDLSTVVETLPQQDGAHLRTVLDRFRNGLFQALRASGCEEDSGLASI
ncbi:MAG: DNA-binding transcriptional repressor MarR [Deltaproteobacteria bacterium ADurb.Bin207]|jgi:DNA-binding MarR family transcriptional regulator|nr:MAG: DNA-binding transcriptional repressor MarR [Deltaproteobacteria bacterium ADurb.Bin207]